MKYILLFLFILTNICISQNLRSPMSANIKELSENSILYTSFKPLQRISVSQDGSLVDENGIRQKFIGGILANTACFPDSLQAIRIAKRFQAMGMNSIRMINFDFPFWDQSSILIPFSTQRSDALNPEQMKKFDWFVYQLHEHGIYVHLTFFTLFSPRINDNAGVTAVDYNWQTLGRIVNYIDSDYQRVQKQILSLFFNHTNPYLQTAYKDYKGLLAVDITDRNSMIQYLVGGHLHPQSQGGSGLYAAKYTSKLDTLFNQYLQNKYTTDQNRKTAWRTLSPDTSNVLQNYSFEDRFSSVWNFFTYEGTVAITDYSETNKTDGQLGMRILIQNPGSDFWHIQLYQAFPKIEKYRRYKISFDAKTSVASRRIFVQVHNSEAPYQNYGLANQVSLTGNWQNYSLEFKAKESDLGPRLMFGLGVDMGDVFLDNIRVQEVSDPVLPQNETIQNLTVKRILINDPFVNQGIIADNMEFYTQLMENFNTSMYEYLKETLNVQCLVGSNQEHVTLNDVYSIRSMDFSQTGTGWDWRRRISDNGPDSVWRIDNNPMLSVTWGGNIGNVGRSKIKGKPMFLSRVGMPFPNSSLHEMVTVWPAYAAFQDWDVLYMDNLTDNIEILNTTSYIKDNHNSHWNNNSLLSFFQPMKTMFVHGGVSKGTEVLEIPQTLKALENPIIDQQGMFWLNGPADGRVPLFRRTELAGFDNQQQAYRPQEQISQLSSEFGVDLSKLVTDTEEINWNAIDTTFTVNSPKVKVVTGKVTSKIFQMDDVQLTFLDPLGYGSLAVTSLENMPIRQSKNMLVTVASRNSHINSIWQQNNTIWQNWGTGVVLSEALQVNIRIDSDFDSLVVNVLDENGMTKRSFNAEKIAAKRYRILLDQKIDNSYWFHIQGFSYPTSVTSEERSQPIEIFPHPVVATSTVTVPSSLNHANRRVKLKDVFGNVVMNFGEIGSEEQTMFIQSSALANGIYFLQILEGTEQQTVKVIVQK